MKFISSVSHGTLVEEEQYNIIFYLLLLFVLCVVRTQESIRMGTESEAWVEPPDCCHLTTVCGVILTAVSELKILLIVIRCHV